jgi:hypothetical protein
VEDVVLIEGHHPTSGRLRRPYLHLGEVVIDELGSPAGDHLQPLMETLWLAAGWPTGSPSYDDNGHWTPYGEGPEAEAIFE